MNRTIVKDCKEVDLLLNGLEIKGEMHETVQGDLSSANEYSRNISVLYSIAIKELDKMEAGTLARTVIKSSKHVTKFMNRILMRASKFEMRMKLAPDYDLTNESKIHSLGWYALLIRQTMRHQDVLTFQKRRSTVLSVIGSYDTNKQ